LHRGQPVPDTPVERRPGILVASGRHCELRDSYAVEVRGRQVGTLCSHNVHPAIVEVGELGVTVIVVVIVVVGHGAVGHGYELPRAAATQPYEHVPGDVRLGRGLLQPDWRRPLSVSGRLQETVVADAQRRLCGGSRFRTRCDCLVKRLGLDVFERVSVHQQHVKVVQHEPADGHPRECVAIQLELCGHRHGRGLHRFEPETTKNDDIRFK